MVKMLSNSEKRRKSIMLMVITAMLWSLGGVLIKNITWNPIAIAASRSFVAALIILIFIDKPLNRLNRDKLLGGIFYALTVILFVIANKYTTAANAILLQYTAPVYIILFGYFVLGEKSYIYDYITVLLVVLGMVLFFFDTLNGGGMIGNVAAIFSGVAFAFTAIFMRKQKNYNPLESVFWGNLFTAVICSFGFFLSPPIGNRSLFFIVILGVFQLGIPYILYAKAIKNVSALEATLIPVIEPLLNPIWVILVNNEVPSIWSIIGGAIVLAAVTGRTLYVLSRDRSNN
jgi:drug/metabolite transporter (DMT)-like permease